MLKQIAFILLILVNPTAIAAEEPDHAIHEELRALLQDMEKAVNEERYGDLAPYFHENLLVTPIDQETISSREGISEYFNRLFGPGGMLKKVDMKLTADARTQLYGDKTFGIVRGSGDEDYVLSDTRTYNMKTRWTATVIKDTDDRWRILTLHIGTNFLDNELLSEAEGALMSIAVVGFVMGAVLVLALNLIYRRIKSKSA